MIRFYTYGYQALDDLKNDLSDVQRAFALRIVLSEDNHCYEFVRRKLWKNDKEKQWMLEKALRIPNLAAQLIDLEDILNDKQRELALERILEIPHLSLKYLQGHHDKIDLHTKRRLIDTTCLIRNNVNTLFSYKDIITVEDNLYVLEKFQHIHDVMFSFLKLAYTREGNRADRRFAFDAIKDNQKMVLELAYNKQLTATELKYVYEHISPETYKTTKRSYKQYLKYCVVFSKFISIAEQKVLVDKLSKPTYRSYVQSAMNKITFDEQFIPKLNSMIVLQKLKEG